MNYVCSSYDTLRLIEISIRPAHFRRIRTHFGVKRDLITLFELPLLGDLPWERHRDTTISFLSSSTVREP